MKYILKPKGKKRVEVHTRWENIEDKSKYATCIETYRYEEFEIQLAEGIDIEELKIKQDFDLADFNTFTKYEWLDSSPLSGDVTDVDRELHNCDSEEQEKIESGEIYELDDWEQNGDYYRVFITCECDFIPVVTAHTQSS